MNPVACEIVFVRTLNQREERNVQKLLLKARTHSRLEEQPGKFPSFAYGCRLTFEIFRELGAERSQLCLVFQPSSLHRRFKVLVAEVHQSGAQYERVFGSKEKWGPRMAWQRFFILSEQGE